MANKWQYVGKMQLPADLPTGVLDEWETTLKAERARILASLTAKIPNETAFQSFVADASSDQYSAFLATVGGAWDVNVIEMKQRVKLARKYTDWSSGIASAFAPSGTFETNVTAKKNKYKLARYVMGVVGHRPSNSGAFGVWNPAVIGALLMRGDTRPSRYFDANDSFVGTLEAVMDAKLGKLITPSIIAETVFASIMAKFADEGGLTTIRDNIITASNTTLDTLLNVALDATHKGGGYDVTSVLAWSAPDLHCSLTVTDVHP